VGFDERQLPGWSSRLIAGLFVMGCLAPDPETDLNVPEIVPEETARASVRSAPTVIDSSILRNRAFTEAPMLAADVEAGRLPPISERLPENPLVVVPIEEIG
jgi:hypothetical protein